jgi:4-amino-4-deoxy-L-arabinose transferase-like glycosyltransferase
VKAARGRTTWIVAAILLVSLAVRVAFPLAFPLAAPAEDAARYDMSARRILAGKGFAYPLEPGTPSPAQGAAFERFLGTRANAFTTPGYAYFLAGVYGVAGQGEARWAAARLANCLLSVASLLLLYLIALRAVGKRAALIALVLAALFPTLVWVDGFLLTETLFVCLLLVWTLVTLVALERKTWPYFAASGALLGVLTLVRPTAIFWVLAVAAYMLLTKAFRWRRFLALAGVTALAFCLVMAPWWVRNAALYGHPVWLTTASSNPIAAATSPGYRAGGRPIVPFPPLADDEALGRYWATLAQKQIADILHTDPLGYVRIKLLNTRYAVLHPWPGAPPTLAWTNNVVGLYWYAIMSLAAVGLFARRREPLVWLVFALPASIFFVHLLTLMLDRYLHPVLWLLAIPAAAGVQALVGLRRHRQPA